MESSTSSQRKKPDRPLSPKVKVKDNKVISTTSSATTALSSDEDVDVVEKRPDLVKNPKTIQELNDALQRYLIYHPRSEAVFNFKGHESIDEIVAALFVLERTQNGVEGGGVLDNAEKERLYQKLMTDLRAVGYDRENMPPLRDTPLFESTEDLLNCLVADSPTPDAHPGDSASQNNSTTDPATGDKVRGHADRRRQSEEDKPKSPFTELLEKTSSDIMEGDLKSSFDDISLEEDQSAMDLDEVEGSDLLRPPPPASMSKTQRRKSSAESICKGRDTEGGDSFNSHSADTTLSTSPSHFLPKNKDDTVNSNGQGCTTSGAGEYRGTIDAAKQISQGQVEVTTPVKKVAEVVDPNGSELTEDDLNLIKRFGLSPCSVRITELKERKTEKSEEVAAPPTKTRRKRSKGTSSIRRISPRKGAPSWKKSQSIAACAPTVDEHNRKVSESELFLPLEHGGEPSNKVDLVVVGKESQASTFTTPTPPVGKTRIKARKLTDEELALAAASSLTPEELILRRLISTQSGSTACETDNKNKPYTMFGLGRNIKNEPLGNDKTNQKHPGDTPGPGEQKLLEQSSHPKPVNDSQVCHIPQQPQSTDADVNPSIVTSQSVSSDTTLLVRDVTLQAQAVNLPSQSQPSPAKSPGHQLPPPSSSLTPPVAALVDSPVDPGSGASASSRRNRSIEQELDDLLGVIPVFDIDDDDDLDNEQMGAAGDSSSASSLHLQMPQWFEMADDNMDDDLVDILSCNQSQPRLPLGSQNSKVAEKQSTSNENFKTSPTPPPPVEKTESPASNPPPVVEGGSKLKVLPSKKSAGRPGPKSKTKNMRSPEPSTIPSDPVALNPENKSESNPSKRRKVSPSSSSSSDSYLPLVAPKVKSNSAKSKSPGAELPKPSTIPTPEKIILVDVDEDVSSSSGGSSESGSDADVEDIDDLFAILPPKRAEKILVNEMQDESGKNKPSESRLKELMGEIRPYMRRFLESDNYDIDHGMKVFPALKNYKILKSEYNEFNPAVSGGRMAMLEKELKDSLNNATTVKKRPGQKRHHLWELALQNSKNGKSLSKGMKRVLGMICLCFHLAENHVATNLLLVRKRGEPLDWQSISTPRIVMYEDEVQSEEAKTMYIYAEGLKHVKVPNVYEGVLTVYSLHYVFSVEYLAPLRPIFKHFDNLAKIKT